MLFLSHPPCLPQAVTLIRGPLVNRADLKVAHFDLGPSFPPGPARMRKYPRVFKKKERRILQVIVLPAASNVHSLRMMICQGFM